MTSPRIVATISEAFEQTGWTWPCCSAAVPTAILDAYGRPLSPTAYIPGIGTEALDAGPIYLPIQRKAELDPAAVK